ncbi:MAG: aminoacyl-tRNA hydrolase [Caldithrix sp.]|nr:aminoacyl-tRNA hydrolase [Caldithrix sp.]
MKRKKNPNKLGKIVSWAVFGLGNPGKRYQMTRHNVGYLFLDYFSAKYNSTFSSGKGPYENCMIQAKGEHLMLVKPTTFMNLSGMAVKNICEAYGLSMDRVIIIFDDFNLPLGTLRFRARGSDGGHNGIRSIIEHMDTMYFKRLKIGVGNTFDDSVQFVLSDFRADERIKLETIMPYAAEGLELCVSAGINEAMNNFNRYFIE